MADRTLLQPSDDFAPRHLGVDDADVAAMLDVIGVPSLTALVEETIPGDVRLDRTLDLPAPLGETDVLDRLRAIASDNRVVRSLIGAGYYDTITPPVIQRNVLENPGWYTQYTPYQAEIAQGRLEVLLTFQTMVSDLSGLELANASLLDEATAAAEAMAMCFASGRRKRPVFLVADDAHPQTIAVLQTRAEPMGIEVRVAPTTAWAFDDSVCGALVQTPTTDGTLLDVAGLADAAHGAGALLVVASDLLALTVSKSPGSMGADIAIGSAQRFGVPMGYGGPHAAWLATHKALVRNVPGRIIGVSKDRHGNRAYRMAIQTREQHIRRDKATSNICTAQALLAIMAGLYACWHGPEGLRRIADRVRTLRGCLAASLSAGGLTVDDAPAFDTVRVRDEDPDALVARALAAGFNVRRFDDGVGISLDERSTPAEIDRLAAALVGADAKTCDATVDAVSLDLPSGLARDSEYLDHEVFHAYRTEHEMLRYLHRMQARDLSLTTSMIPLGSCTMKLNATTEMAAVTWPEFASLHPFAPLDQAAGYRQLFHELEASLAEITGFDAVSLQPNAGSQGEYTGLLVIRAYHRARGESHRNVCLIPVSAHGTNPASAAMAGMKVVAVKCDDAGNIDVDDLRARAEQHADRLSALMVTYPSTHGVFETTIREVCDIVHAHGGQVYLDGANMNAQVGLCRPGDMGADVCHLNLHKTFCIPHGGGGPGMGPIGVVSHLAPYLPGHPLVACGGDDAIGPVSAAPWGSPSILPISWAYIRMMGAAGLERATEVAILNANYMAARLAGHFDVLYTGPSGRVAHEFILDLRPFRALAGIEPDDVAKRLMDYGFHAPTMSWPVAGTLMVEPTESESRAELDRFCDAMIAIRDEIRAIEDGTIDRDDNPLKNAPHTAGEVAGDWSHGYTREQAAYPAAWVREHKFWPVVGRVDNAYGDRHLVCSCPPVEAFVDED